MLTWLRRRLSLLAMFEAATVPVERAVVLGGGLAAA